LHLTRIISCLAVKLRSTAQTTTCDCWRSQDVCRIDAAANANLQDDHVRLRVDEDAQTWQQQQQQAAV
jgi:hypothetical protein